MSRPRAHALRNRAAIVAAARRVFFISGVTAPLDEVVVEAGVGRGTLYRHFRDRIDLAAAVYDEEVASYESFARAGARDPEIVLRLMGYITASQSAMAGMLTLLSSAPEQRSEVGRLSDRTRRLLDRHIPAARQVGALPSHIDADDLLLVLDMMEGIIATHAPQDIPAARRRLLDLLGLTPRSGAVQA